MVYVILFYQKVRNTLLNYFSAVFSEILFFPVKFGIVNVVGVCSKLMPDMASQTDDKNQHIVHFNGG